MPKTLSSLRGLVLLCAALLLLQQLAPSLAAAEPEVVIRWGPLRVGDKVGLKEVGPAYDLEVAREVQTTGYTFRQVQRLEGTVFLIFTPPEAVQLAPGLVREVWIPATSIRAVRVR
jgi:hypothetical protein